jgi:hypothetical protein
MASRRAGTAFLFVQLIAIAASAQQSAEFGRASGGTIVMTPKVSSSLSGSLNLSMSSGSDLFGLGSSAAYGVTAGGALIQDRLWFFAAGSREEISPSRFAELELPENLTAGAIAARVNGHIGGGHDFSSFFQATRRPALSTTAPSAFAGIAPSSFLSLRHTGIVSSNMFFNVSFTRSSRTVGGVGIVPAD